MKKYLILAALITLLFVAVTVSAEVAFATAHPLRPDQALFPLQDFAERVRERITPGIAGRSAYALEVADMRADDLFVLAGSEDVQIAALHLDQAVERLVTSANKLSEGDSANLLDDLSCLTIKLRILVDDFGDESSAQIETKAMLQAKISALETLLSNLNGGNQMAVSADLKQMLQVSENLDGETNGTQVPPHSIQFPPGSPGAEHQFFQLDGAHQELECMDCHDNGQYAGTPNLCIDCHADRLPENHYGENCSGCHSATSWQAVLFNHDILDTSDCQACHLDDSAVGHYSGQCSACHNNVDWQRADFSHQAVDTQDCLSCHSEDRPENHFQAQCSACHITSSWTRVDFNHQAVGATDCQSCHNNRKPTNHYGGQCSACHNTTNWSQANFNHQAVGATDCKACHSGRKPANHFGGQCSACHSTSQWAGAKFNHGAAGATDCKACHSGRKPANHFDGQCSKCHTTSTWGGASFNHKFPMNHGDANGKCSQCHPSGGSQFNCFACHDKGKINNEHSEEGISNFVSRCLDCHPRGKEGGGGDDDDD